VQTSPSVRWPNVADRTIAITLAVAVVVFGALVVYKSALLEWPMGDLGVYLRAAWAAQADPDHLYDYTDYNGWHYSYPPLFALLMRPLAEAPGTAGADPMSFAFAVAVFYFFNIGCLFMAVHVLASALIQKGETRRRAFFSPLPCTRGRGVRRFAVLVSFLLPFALSNQGWNKQAGCAGCAHRGE